MANWLSPGSGRVCGVMSVCCESGLFVEIAGPGICVLRILVEPSVQSYCTLSISDS